MTWRNVETCSSVDYTDCCCIYCYGINCVLLVIISHKGAQYMYRNKWIPPCILSIMLIPYPLHFHYSVYHLCILYRNPLLHTIPSHSIELCSVIRKLPIVIWKYQHYCVGKCQLAGGKPCSFATVECLLCRSTGRQLTFKTYPPLPGSSSILLTSISVAQ